MNAKRHKLHRFVTLLGEILPHPTLSVIGGRPAERPLPSRRCSASNVHVTRTRSIQNHPHRPKRHPHQPTRASSAASAAATSKSGTVRDSLRVVVLVPLSHHILIPSLPSLFRVRLLRRLLLRAARRRAPLLPRRRRGVPLRHAMPPIRNLVGERGRTLLWAQLDRERV